MAVNVLRVTPGSEGCSKGKKLYVLYVEQFEGVWRMAVGGRFPRLPFSCFCPS